MQELAAIHITREQGLAGDARGKPGRRQVTVLSQQSWQEACALTQSSLPWTARRANLLVSGLSFSAQDVGKILGIGAVRLEIMRETDPCQRMEAACPGLRQALTPDWRGGVCCRVIEPGEIALDDPVELIEAPG